MLDLHDSQLKVNVFVELTRSMKSMNDIIVFILYHTWKFIRDYWTINERLCSSNGTNGVTNRCAGILIGDRRFLDLIWKV